MQSLIQVTKANTESKFRQKLFRSSKIDARSKLYCRYHEKKKSESKKSIEKIMKLDNPRPSKIRSFYSLELKENYCGRQEPTVDEFIEDRYSIADSNSEMSDEDSFHSQSSIIQKCDIDLEQGVVHEEQNFSSSEEYDEE